MAPCVIFEDEHLLVVNKPTGWNTHAPGPHAGEGIYDWLRHREPRWATLAILHRLDKETSGVMVFGKTPAANRSLTEQFTERRVRKKYLLLTDRPVPQREFTVKTALVRVGEKYASRPPHAGAEIAETRFGVPALAGADRLKAGLQTVEASPVTGRTHQIRVHAAEKGFPILGDTLYGGTPAARGYLHAAELTLQHPASGKEMTFRSPLAGASGNVSTSQPGLEDDGGCWLTAPLPCLALREGLIDREETNAYRLIHNASDRQAGWYVDRLGDFLLSQSEAPLSDAQREELGRLAQVFSARGAYHKILRRRAGRAPRAEASPQLGLGEAAPERFTVRENSG